MKVSQRMTPNPITITPQHTHHEAVALMRENKIRRLPVLDKKGALVGIVSEKDLLSAAPSPATTLSVYEIYSLLDKLTIDKVMSHPVYAVEESCSLPSAARFMIDKKIGCLPVVHEGTLVGIITETDIFKTFVELLGGDEPGLRLDVNIPDRIGMLADLTRAIADAGGSIVSLSTFHGADTVHSQVSIKERGADAGQLRNRLAAMSDIEIVELRSGNANGLLQLGK